MAPTNSWNPGYRFKDGRLLVFERDRITLVQAWPEPEAAQKNGDGRWQPFWPEFRLVRPYRRRKPPQPAPPTRQLLLPMSMPPATGPSATAPRRAELAEQKRRAFDALRFSLPREIASAIERFTCGQFALLHLLAANDAFLDLLTSNPALAFLLADHHRRGRLPTDARDLAAQKQAELAGSIGLPATAAAARTLRKLVPESITPASGDQLAAALRDEHARERLSHLRRINAGVLRLLGDAELRAVATPTLLEEVAADPREKYRAETADRLLDVLALERELHGAPRTRSFTGIERVRAALHAIRTEYASTQRDDILRCRFPSPPIRGTADIVPLTKPLDLVAEGARQHNCVASYAPAVARGETFVYRVLVPERATLAIRRDHGSWYCAELRAACNRDVRRATLRAVEDWLAEGQVSV